MSQSQNMTHVLIHAIHGLVSRVDVVRNLRISRYAFAKCRVPCPDFARNSVWEKPRKQKPGENPRNSE